MDLHDQRDLLLLNEVGQDGSVSQRSLSKKLGLALGLTNLYIKRLARKGYIKITTIPRSRIKYLLTPQGMTEKSRLTYQYMQYSLTYYRQMRSRLADVLAKLSISGARRIAIYGTGELAEMAYVSIRGTDIALVGFLDGDAGRGTFLSYPLWPIEAIKAWDYDAVLIAELAGVEAIRARLIRASVPSEKIVSLVPKA